MLIFLTYICGEVEKALRHGSLFTGIGGFDLAAEWMEWVNIFQVENNGWCQKRLIKNFPKVKRYGDIKEFTGRKYRGQIDILTGGFPCQPFSHAGKRTGEADERYLWVHMLKVIGAVKPRWVIGENVYGLLTMEGGETFERICVDLEVQGYEVWSFIIPAAAVGAWHRRDRVWIIAHTNGLRESISSVNDYKRSGKLGLVSNSKSTERKCSGDTWSGREGFTDNSKDAANTHNKGLERQDSKELQERTIKQFAGQGDSQDNRTNWELEPSVGRVAHGVPGRVDRLKGLGNAIVPQVAYEIFKIIKQYEQSSKP